jgi:thiamine phosphate synthase YjbQ (UPF0047 family)
MRTNLLFVTEKDLLFHHDLTVRLQHLFGAFETLHHDHEEQETMPAATDQDHKSKGNTFCHF